MSNQFTDKLDKSLDTLGERYIMTEHRLINQGMPEENGKHKELEVARQQILAAIEACLPEKHKLLGSNDETNYDIGQSHGYNQAIADFLTALGISPEKGKD